MAKEKIVVWITKYALTGGIIKRNAELVNEDMIDATTKGDFGGVYYHHKGRDWHTTFDGAVARAEKMRTAKIAALEKQIKKLRALTFDGVV